MNKKLIIIILVLFVGTILIGTGTFLLFTDQINNKNKEIKEIRKYKIVQESSIKGENTFTEKELNKQSFEDKAKDIGFKKVECIDNDCIATNNGYSNFKNKDSVDYRKDEKGDKSLNITLYFHKNDFTVENIYQQLNTIIKNYYSEELPKNIIQEVKRRLETSFDDYYQKTYISGQYTIELNMQNVVGTDFKLVKYQILNTELYNMYHGL